MADRYRERTPDIDGRAPIESNVSAMGEGAERRRGARDVPRSLLTGAERRGDCEGDGDGGDIPDTTARWTAWSPQYEREAVSVESPV